MEGQLKQQTGFMKRRKKIASIMWTVRRKPNLSLSRKELIGMSKKMQKYIDKNTRDRNKFNYIMHRIIGISVKSVKSYNGYI